VARPLPEHIHERLLRAAASATPEEVAKLAAYLDRLAVWNRRINLTAFKLDEPSDDAIDRLIVEPVLASLHIRLYDQTLMDLGSGGGSPAIPLKLMRPWVRLTMVESRARKAAFLREAVRTGGLQQVTVENERYEQLVDRSDLRGRMDLISFRAVRADEELWGVIRACLAPAGRILWFGAPAETLELPSPFAELARQRLGAADASWLVVAGRSV
jgi:16S rRNA (guanine527-N7)-methyltransferase